MSATCVFIFQSCWCLLQFADRHLKLLRVHDPDSTYRLVFRRFQTDQNASYTTQVSHSYSAYYRKPTQFISPIDHDSLQVRYRADTVPISTAATTTARRRNESASATASRTLYELHNPDVAFSKSKNAIEGLIRRNNSSMVAQRWTCKPLYADQLEFDEEGQLRFGTLKALVEKLTCAKSRLDFQCKALLSKTSMLRSTPLYRSH